MKTYFKIRTPIEFARKGFFRRSPAFAWVLLFAMVAMGVSIPGVIIGFVPALLGSVLIGDAVLSLFFYGLGACDKAWETVGNVSNETNDLTDRGWFLVQAAQWMTLWYVIKILCYAIGYLFHVIFMGIANLAIFLFYWPRGEE